VPTPAEALGEPLRAFPSWFLRVECERCGKVAIVNESHARWPDRTIADILYRMRHDGCGGLPGKAELLTGIEGRRADRCGGSYCVRDDRLSTIIDRKACFR
jgi:hypothetical protein